MTTAAVDARPQLTPPNVSLINAAIVVTEVDERWEMGFQYVPEACGTADVYNPCNPNDAVVHTTANASTAITGTPYAISASDTCSTWGFQVREYEERAIRMLKAIESFKIARELWENQSGLGLNPWLAGTGTGAASTITTNAKPKDVLGLLESSFYASSPAQRAMIHMSPRLLERLQHDSGGAALRREGNNFYTWMDSIVAVDAGYRGVGPGGQGGEWAYVTPVVVIREGPIRVTPDTISEATIIRQNEVSYFADRIVQATWDYNCQSYTLSVDLT